MRSLFKTIFQWFVFAMLASGCGKSGGSLPTPATPFQPPPSSPERVVKKVELQGTARIEFTRRQYSTSSNCIQYVTQGSLYTLEFSAGSCRAAAAFADFSLFVDAAGGIWDQGRLIGQYQDSTSEIFFLCSSSYETVCEPLINTADRSATGILLH